MYSCIKIATQVRTIWVKHIDCDQDIKNAIKVWKMEQKYGIMKIIMEKLIIWKYNQNIKIKRR